MNDTLEELPLLSRTPDSWAKRVLQYPRALLTDHAHLERKAAANALELLNRCPGLSCPKDWTLPLCAIARDESLHLQQVMRLLAKNGWGLAKSHNNPYATALRCLGRKGQGPQELLDRLLASALIEARSCERFESLAANCEERDFTNLYRTLHIAERGHHAAFLKLADLVAPPEEVQDRWLWMQEAEARILSEQDEGPRLHSGVGRRPHS